MNFQANSLQPSCREWPLDPVSSLVHPFEKTGYWGHHKNKAMCFTVKRRNVLDKRILVESSPGEKMKLAFHKFGGKGILVCDGIMLGSRTPLYIFDASIVTSQLYEDEILEVYVRFFSVLWARLHFL
ncbi:hypothetical protein TNCV_613841 [Trichonephila clavipes]|nr:hypothetical protein TNCV_613841 [Trichonephila clavipes]